MPSTSSTCGWQPILSAPLASRALDLAEEIARALDSAPPVRRRPAERASLAAGLPGRIVFLGYLERCRPGRGWGDRAVELLEQAMEEIAGLPVEYGLYSGFTGLAWVLEHFHGWLVDEEDDPGEEIAAAVEKVLRSPLSPWEFDLISGAVGMGVYALERLPRPGAGECLRGAVEHLAAAAERRDGTAVWPTPPGWVPEDRRERFPGGYVVTGLAHGVAGVAAFLGEALAAGLPTRPLLDEAVRWLLAAKLPPGPGPVYPYEVAPGDPGRPTRLAWCHGDPGVAAGLLVAARRAGEAAWENEALALARQAAARSAGEVSIIDAGLCHGSAGLAHIFNRLYQGTGDPTLGDAARFWIDRTFDLRRPGEGVAGFLAWENDDAMRQDWRAEPGFLTGAAGVGLALLAAAAPV
ncbi:MAG TPA: lanthionine synthetase C family protein, partial [Thermoanaerobaculia bacterium]|nr:lanthionine synthetase C family protein [Thermoanaerobaculia bacterium]